MVYELRVGGVMQRDVISVGPSTPMSELRDILRANRISGVPVVEQERLVGVVSVEDFIGWLADGGPQCPIADRMSADVTTIYDDEPLVRAVNKLERSGYGRLPVLARQDRRLVGVVTKGDIISGLLKNLEVDYREAEGRRAATVHQLDDIIADRAAVILEYQVAGGDFEQAGTAASRLKTTLRRLGIHPQTARRAAIAAYEAEMNLVVFTEGGRIQARIEPQVMQLVVEDGGPGIPDIEQAMQPGFSTAPNWVRELGFGAGMGLVNIKKCSDQMQLDSTVGEGTRLEVVIQLEPRDGPE
jgi:CBS domain-containing protein/anti-sigma regulatory factor (Ser/Thr protein kinase)